MTDPVAPPWVALRDDGRIVKNTPDNPDYDLNGASNDLVPKKALPDAPVKRMAAPDDARLEPLSDFAPPAPGKKNVAPTSLEKLYSRRAGMDIEQFGYDLFGIPDDATQAALARAGETATKPPMGEIADDFILSAGDELQVTFTGQRTENKIYKIDSRGLIIIPDFPPIPAEGRSIGNVQISVQAAANNLRNTEAYVALSSVRQIGVLVIGHVKRPGRQDLTVFNTAIDALMAAGGVEKTGSLRQIKLVRGGKNAIIDLYDLLLHGEAGLDMRLKDGDRIIVPPIGPTLAAAGEVKRPGIYEILPDFEGVKNAKNIRAEHISLNEILELSGGPLTQGKNRFLKLGVNNAGQEVIEETQDSFAPQFGDGAILMVEKGTEKRAGQVEISGETRRPGLYALSKNKKLSGLLSSGDILGDDIYPLIGVIVRRDQNGLSKTILDFPVQLVIERGFDRTLAQGDVVHLFSLQQIRELDAKNQDSKKQQLDPEIKDFLIERTVFVRGAVRTPGAYPVADGVTLESILAAAGGLTVEANPADIEIVSAHQGDGIQAGQRTGMRRINVNLRDTPAASIAIGPGDSVRVRQKFQRVADKSVLVMGEVLNPGRYDLMPGEKISSVIERAGGLTQDAYPDGAIFSRESERKAEEARFKAQAMSIRRAVSAAVAAEDKKIDAGKIAEARGLADELSLAEGVGRITVEADPAALKADPSLDMLLEPGDRIYIPKRSLSVRVSGEVLSPATLQFRESKDPLDYIHEAGGFAFGADKDRTFVLFPDGSAQPLKVSTWNHRADFIPPGSAIIVPRDPKPFDFIESAKDISQILSNLAVTAIFVDDVRDDD